MASTVAVDTVASLVFSPQQYSTTATLVNTGTSTLYLGQSAVTAATGFPLQPGQSINLTFNTDIYAVASVDSIISPINTIDTGGVSQGGTAIPVAANGTNFTNGMVISIQDGSNSELVTVGSGSTGTSVVISATAHAHAAGVSFGRFQRHNAGAIQVHAQGV